MPINSITLKKRYKIHDLNYTNPIHFVISIFDKANLSEHNNPWIFQITLLFIFNNIQENTTKKKLNVF